MARLDGLAGTAQPEPGELGGAEVETVPDYETASDSTKRRCVSSRRPSGERGDGGEEPACRSRRPAGREADRPCRGGSVPGGATEEEIVDSKPQVVQ